MNGYLFSAGIVATSAVVWYGFHDEAPADRSAPRTVSESKLAGPESSLEDSAAETYDTIELDDGGVIERFDAPDFTLPRLGGGTVTLSEYRGKKPVVIVFWATWCPNCRRDMPKLGTLYRKYRDQMEIIGIDLQESESLVRKFVDANGITYPIALDADGVVGAEYGIQYTNSHVLIDSDGTVVDFVLGDLSEEKLVSFLESEK